jgi:hypothetical protein
MGRGAHAEGNLFYRACRLTTASVSASRPTRHRRWRAPYGLVLNRHHAAALVLLGWCLMLPSLTETSRFHAWGKVEAMTQAGECERDRGERQRQFSEYADKLASSRLLGDVLVKGRCIATDDSRLKAK